MRNLVGGILGTLILIYILSIGILKLPFLRVNSVILEGLKPNEATRIKPLFRSLGRNLIFLNEEKLLAEINERLGDRFERLEVDRKFTKEGVNLNIHFIRRKAVAKVFIGDKVYLVSENGKLFRDENQKVEKVIYLKGINNLDKRFIKLLKYSDRIYVYQNSLKLNLGDRRVLLPFNFSLKELNLLESVIRMNNKENSYKEVDLRYKRFILLRKKL
ncbi:hypothetical protein JCM9492_02580 [Aquifex pyrophilus]